MSQFFGQENVPNIVVASTTTLTLAATNNGNPTVMLVGGQAYTPSSTLTLNTATTGANGLDTGSLGAIQLWYVYAIVNQSTFAPALIASLTGPSTGPSMPSGYGTAYKLVGAFYTNGSSLVGSTVTITGTATTSWITWTPVFVGFGNVTDTNSFSFKRIEANMEIEGRFSIAASTATTASFTLPGSLTNNAVAFNNVGTVRGKWTRLQDVTASSRKIGALFVSNTAQNTIQFVSDDYTTASAPSTTLNGNSIGSGELLEIQLVIPITGWNATLL